MPEDNAIGGFFELERPLTGNGFHQRGYGFANGRTCFRIVLRNVRPSNVYIPYYCCDTLLEPLIIEQIKYEFYPITETFEPLYLPELRDDELFLYINYFGVKTKCVHALVEHYGSQVIIDDTQNYFAQGYQRGWSFNSARKFFGVPDGGYLYSPYELIQDYKRNTNFITDHLFLRLDHRREEAFHFYRKNEEHQNCDLSGISCFTENILKGLDYEFIANRRRENFDFFAGHLGNLNRLHNLEIKGSDVPFCYPLLISGEVSRSLFYSNKIFLPVLWEDVTDRKGNGNFPLERQIVNDLLPLPIDHRYEEKDLIKILHLLN